MTILLLKGYNNCFNKILKKEANITDYKTASTSYLEYPNVNFDTHDGIVTSLVVGNEAQQVTIPAVAPATEPTKEVLKFDDLGSPDYLIVHDNVNIKSRWFVLECIKIRGGQYQLSLKRDVVADFFDDIKDSPCYVEKATITDILNPLLYNKEGLAVNQIKQAEYLLKDRSGVAWIVGYVSQKMTSETLESNFGTQQLNSSGQASSTFYYNNANTISRMWITNIDGSTTYAEGNSGDGKFTYSINSVTKYITYSINLPLLASSTVAVRFTYRLGTSVENNGYSVTLAGDGTRTHVEDAPYDIFCIPFGEITLASANITTTKESALAIALGMSGDLGSFLYDIQLLPYCPRLDMVASKKIYEILGSQDIDYSYIKDSNNVTKNILIWCKKSTFSDYAMPDEDIKIKRQIDEHTYGKQATYTGTLSRVLADPDYVQISITNDNLKDLVNIDVTGVAVTHSSGYNVATQATTNKVYNPETGYLSFRVYDGGDEEFTSGSLYNASINLSYEYQKYMYPEYIDRKVSNECDIYRLTSPNYNGQFEWSLAKGTGTANVFDIDCTYKPFQPYIHVQPIFTNLYGSDFDDCRGLICGGDFSLPIINDAWTQYQIQNKTYQEMFDRQIYHMDIQESYQQANMGIAQMEQLVNGIAGTASNVMHSKNWAQAAGSGALGTMRTGMGLLGSELQRGYQKAAYDETRDFTIDQFNYSLQNVQALPYGLTKVAAYTANNKIFPMVEYYSCKEIEKQALRDKITYNGMTVMVIGKISDYISNSEKRFIKGQLIRLPNIEEDSHVANEIYNEISKGVYI